MNVTNKSEEDSCALGFLDSGKRTRAFEIRFALWTLFWAVCLVLTAALLRNELVVAPYALPLAIVPVLLGVLPLRAYYRFIIQADELVRKIQLDSICITFCLSLLYMIARISLAAAGLEPADAEHIVVAMCFFWGLSQLYCTWKYR